MKTVSYTFAAPAIWASALVNGDFSGLNPEESARARLFESDLRNGYIIPFPGRLLSVDVARDEGGEPEAPYFARSAFTEAASYIDWESGEFHDYVAIVAVT